MFFPPYGGNRILGKTDCNSHINAKHVEKRGHWLEVIKLKDTCSKASDEVHAYVR